VEGYEQEHIHMSCIDWNGGNTRSAGFEVPVVGVIILMFTQFNPSVQFKSNLMCRIIA
jgi:hypothetical protein